MNLSVYNFQTARFEKYKTKNTSNKANQFCSFDKNLKNSVTFKGESKKSQPIKRVAPWLLSGLMILGGTKTCGSSSDKYTGTDNNDGIKVEYYDVSKNTHDSLMEPVFQLKSNLTSDNDFLEGVKFDIAKSFAQINPDEPFEEHLVQSKANEYLKGTSFYSDKKLQKHVAVQETAHGGINSNYEMRFSLMHEVGHQFDNYFGHNHNADYAQKWDSLVASKENPYDFITVTPKDQELDIEYNYNNSLSDRIEFQNALLKDLKNILRLKRRHDIMPQNMDYYIGHFNLQNQITPEDVDGENAARAEIYASLFAYALGQDDGDKEIFIKCFPNCYKIVKNDINKYINVTDK